MSQRITLVAAVAVVLAASHLAGQVPGNAPGLPLAGRYYDPDRGLSLEQAIVQAGEREPTLRAARTTIDAARGMRVQAGLRPNPTASFERREEPGGTDHQTSVSIEWPLDLFRRAGRVAVADREIEATEHAVAERERVLASNVRMQYGQVLAAVRDLMVSDELVAAARKQHDVVRTRVDAGATPPLERDLLEVDVRRLESAHMQRAGRADVALLELKRIIGLSPAAPLTVRDTLEDLVGRDQALPTPENPKAEQPSAAINQRPDVREAEARVRMAKARVDRVRRDGQFEVSVFGSYTRTDAGFPQFGFAQNGGLERVRGLFNYVAAGAMITVPLRNRNQGDMAVAQAERAGAEALEEAARLAAQTELAAAEARDLAAQQAMAVYTAGARQLAQRNLSVVSQTYELGRASVFDVLSEQRRYLETEQAYTDALREAYEARTLLKRALGVR